MGRRFTEKLNFIVFLHATCWYNAHSLPQLNQSSICRNVEQLVLYMRSQQYLSACYQLAKTGFESGGLKKTKNLYDCKFGYFYETLGLGN